MVAHIAPSKVINHYGKDVRTRRLARRRGHHRRSSQRQHYHLTSYHILQCTRCTQPADIAFRPFEKVGLTKLPGVYPGYAPSFSLDGFAANFGWLRLVSLTTSLKKIGNQFSL